VAPGPIWRTPLQVSGGASQEKLKKFGGQTPMGRPGEQAELASIYVQLAAEDASYATSHVYGRQAEADNHNRNRQKNKCFTPKLAAFFFEL
jgi:NAD(P)-dependent dehydrogenase (short-subunit alcohol dehydrogenase family)